MLYNFKKILDIERYADFKHVNLHISYKECEISTIDNIIDFAHNKPDGEKYISFLQEYKSQIEEHITLIKQTIIDSNKLSKDLNEFLDIRSKEDYTKNDMITIGNHSFYISYYKGEFYFITQIKYDSHLKMDMYLIFTYLYNGKKLKLKNSAIGYTDKDLNELRIYPSFLVQEIERMDTLTNVEDINSQYSKCQELLKKLFKISDVYDLFSFEDSYYTDFFEEPIKLLPLMYGKRINNIIKNQLIQNNVTNITPDLINLIRIETRYINDIFDKDFDTKESFDKRTKKLETEKNSLMTTLEIDQNLLDNYMSYINLE